MSAAELPGSLRTNPRLSTWLRFAREGYVELAPGKVEIGQGILTALTQIAADELDVPADRVHLARTTTGRSPNEGVTSSSLSVQDGGIAVRFACAEARAIYLAAAAERLGVPADSLSVNDGTIIGPGNARTSYWELADDGLLARDATASAPPKASTMRRVAGTSAQRLDIPDKTFGRPRFMHDLRLPNLLHARMLRPRQRGSVLEALDEAPARAVAGVVTIVRDGNHLGLLAEDEVAAEAGLRALAKGARWSEGWALPPQDDMRAWMKAQKVESRIIDARGEMASGAARTLRRAYSKPYIAHASLAPSCAVAQWRDGGVEIWSHTQGVYNLRAELGIILKLPLEKIVVRHVEGAGCYGHNGADDVALDAVLLARGAEGRPVRLQWSREDELAWSPFGPAMVVDIEADLDAAGDIVAWRHDLWSNGHVGRPGRSQLPTLLAASEIAEPFERFIAGDPPQATGGGSDRNSIPYYDFPSWRVTAHRLLTMPLRTSAMRTLGGFANIFAIESFVDEVAHARDEDPLAFRLRHLSDPRARAVLEAVAVRAGWHTRRKAEGRGFGIGFGRYKNTGSYCACVAEIDCGRDLRVLHLWLAVDVGEVVNPDGLSNQVEGGAIQATSWALKEQVRFDERQVMSETWETYPILTFSETPEVDVEIIARPDEAPKGAGEAAHSPTVAAIANALFDAIGVRVRDLPLTRERIAAAM